MKQPYTLITGASGGIGKALAELAAQDGHNLVLVARDKSGLETVATKLRKNHQVDVLTYAYDLSLPDSPVTFLREIAKQKIVVDTLINNAGFGDYGSFPETDVQQQTSMIDLNVRALTELTRHILPDMIERGHGRIMNVGSIAAFFPGPYMAVYFASKAYVLSFSEALAEEVRGTGVTVTCLCPGSTKTGFAKAAHVKKNHSTATTKVTPEQVAQYGWNAMKQGRVIAVHGFMNKVMVQLPRFSPRAAVVRAVGRMQG